MPNKSALEHFTHIRDCVDFIAYLREKLDDMQSSTGPHGQSFDSVGHGSGGNGQDAAILAIIQAKMNYEHERARVNAMIDAALDILYGHSGHGGLAKVRSSADADCICGYYLMAMSWPEVASEIVRPDSKDGAQWCKRRAYRALEFIDKYGAQKLANS